MMRGPARLRVLQKKIPVTATFFWWAFGHADPAAAGWLGGLAKQSFFYLSPSGYHKYGMVWYQRHQQASVQKRGDSVGSNSRRARIGSP